MNYLKQYKKIVLGILVTAFAIVTLITVGLVSSQTNIFAHAGTFSSPVPLTGYVWASLSKSGLGWISLNCSNESECGSGDYKVVINTDKTVTGYAWGEYVGWVQFGSLSGCPSGGDCDAKVVGDDASGYALSGWARALSATDDPDGWDGWISLNCENHSGCVTSDYKVTLSNSGGFLSNSNAWGDVVLGRVNFAFADYNAPCVARQSCTTDYLSTEYTNQWCETAAPIACTGEQTCRPFSGQCEDPPVITGNLNFDPSLVRKGNSVTLSWTLDGNYPVMSCRAVGNNGDEVTTSPGTTKIIDTSVSVYTLYCIPEGGGAEVEVDSAELRAVASVYAT